VSLALPRLAACVALLVLACAQDDPPPELEELSERPGGEITIITDPRADQEGKHSQAKLDAEAAGSRDSIQRPAYVMEQMGLSAGQVIADVGCGAGYFSFHFSKVVGDEGLIYCIDSDPNAVAYVKQRLEQTGVRNIQLVFSAFDDTLLQPGSVDMAFLADVHFFHNPAEKAVSEYLADFVGFYGSVHRAVKSGGKLVVLESSKEAANGRNVDEDDIAGQLAPFGFELVLRERIPDRPQYFLIFERLPAPEPEVDFARLASVMEALYPGSTSTIDGAPPPAEGIAPRSSGAAEQGCRPTPMPGREGPTGASQGVVVTGSFSAPGARVPAADTKPRMILVDIFSADTPSPNAAYHLRCNTLGPFELLLPRELGAVHIAAFLDEQGDGPSLDDAAAITAEPLLVGSEPIDGVHLLLQPEAGLDAYLPANATRPPGEPPAPPPPVVGPAPVPPSP